MLVLAMTSALFDHLPAICFHHLDYVPEFQIFHSLFPLATKALSVSSFIDHNPCAEPPRVKMTPMLTDRPSYLALEAHYQQIHRRHLRDLFAADAGRGERMRAEAAGLDQIGRA